MDKIKSNILLIGLNTTYIIHNNIVWGINLLKKKYLFLIILVFLFAVSAVSAEEIGNETNLLVNNHDSSLTTESVDENILTDSYETFHELQDEKENVEKSGFINLTVPELTKYYGGPERFVVTLTDDDNPLPNQQIHIVIKGATYTRTTDDNGEASLAINLNSDVYDVAVNYEDISVNSKITVLSTINAGGVEISGNSGVYYATFLDSSGNYLAKHTEVTFYFNDIYTVEEIIDNKGTAILDIGGESGEYIITAFNPVTGEMSTKEFAVVSYINDNNDYDSNDYLIYVPNVTKYYKESKMLYVTLKDKYGQPMANEDVKITLNGQTYIKTTDNEGIASKAIDLNSGKYDVVTEYRDSKVYSTVTVVDTVVANDFTKIYRNGTQYYATFLDSNGNAIAENTPIEININGVFYTRYTNDKGVARMNINLNPGTYILTATNPVTGEQHTTKITVLSSIVENNNIVMNYKDGSRYQVKIIGDDGKPAGAGVKVRFNINGVFYDRTTDANGYAGLNINLIPGTYTITAEYNDLRASNTIRISSVLESKNLNMKFRDGSKFEAKIVDNQGNPHAGQTVTFNINGVFYTKTTDYDGIARLSINLPAGEYIITSSYNGLNAANSVNIAPDYLYYTIGSNPLDYDYYMNEYNKFSFDWHYSPQWGAMVRTIYDVYGNQGMEIQDQYIHYGTKYVCWEESTGKEITLNSAGEVIRWSYGRGYSEEYIRYDYNNNIIERGKWVYQ